MTTTTEEIEKIHHMPLLKGKKIVIFGVANKWSIAWAIAQSLANAGAQLAITYIDERMEEKVRELVKTLPHHPLVLPCDVTKEDQVETVFKKIQHEFGQLDGLIHAIAFAGKKSWKVHSLRPPKKVGRSPWILAPIL